MIRKIVVQTNIPHNAYSTSPDVNIQNLITVLNTSITVIVVRICHDQLNKSRHSKNSTCMFVLHVFRFELTVLITKCWLSWLRENITNVTSF